MAEAGAPTLSSTAGTPPMPNLANPQVQQTFANQAVAGGNPYGPPPTLRQSTAAAQALGTPVSPGQTITPGPSPADLAAGEAFAASQQGLQMTPAMQQYINQFKASQQAQSQALNSSLIQALQGLGERRDAAAKVAATLPGAYQAAYQQANQAQNQAAQTVGREALGRGVPPASAATAGAARADEAAIAASNAGQRAAGQAAQPLLSAGITADYSKGATTLANTNMENQAAIQQQQQQFEEQLALANAQYQQQQQAANQGLTNQEKLLRFESSLGSQSPNGGLTPYQAAQLGLEQQRLNDTHGTTMAAQQARQIAADAKSVGLDPAQYQAALQSPGFQQFVVRLQAYNSDQRNTADEPVLMLKGLKASGDTTLAKALLAAGIVTAEQVSAA